MSDPSNATDADLPLAFRFRDTGPESRAAAKAAREERLTRAGVDPRPGRRLVSLGWCRSVVPGVRASDPPTTIQYELLYDPRHSSELFARFTAGGAIEPFMRPTTEPNKVIDRGVMPRRARPSGYWPASSGGPTKTLWSSADDDD